MPKNFLLERQLQAELSSIEMKNACGKFCNLCYDKTEVRGLVAVAKRRNGSTYLLVYFAGDLPLCELQGGPV